MEPAAGVLVLAAAVVERALTLGRIGGGVAPVAMVAAGTVRGAGAGGVGGELDGFVAGLGGGAFVAAGRGAAGGV